MIRTRKTIPEGKIRINNRIDYNSTSSELIDLIGNPSETGTQYWEMAEATVDIYDYKGATLFFLDGTLESFKLTSNEW